MVLKESFNYQNVLTSFVDDACAYLSLKDNITKREQSHLRKVRNKDAEDEVIVVNAKKGDFVVDNNIMIKLLNALMEEKINLSMAISAAKKNAAFDVDVATENNKLRQRVARIYSKLSSIKSEERETEGTDYAWNQEGNQTSYRYTIKEVTTIDFDRNETKKLGKKINEKADEVSTLIDKAYSSIEVAFTPKFDIHDTFEDVYAKFSSEN